MKHETARRARLYNLKVAKHVKSKCVVTNTEFEGVSMNLREGISEASLEYENKKYTKCFLFSGSPQVGKRYWSRVAHKKARIRGELGSRFGNQAYRDLR